MYNQQFEASRLEELAARLPEFADQIKKIQARLWDLLPVVRNHVYLCGFCGCSHSRITNLRISGEVQAGCLPLSMKTHRTYGSGNPELDHCKNA